MVLNKQKAGGEPSGFPVLFIFNKTKWESLGIMPIEKIPNQVYNNIVLTNSTQRHCI